MTEATPDATSPSPSPSDSPAPVGDEMGYADALVELERILDELDGDEVDVDVLGARVRRASELLRLCRARIAGARFEVEQVVGELEAEADAAASAAARGDDLDVGAPASGGAAGRSHDPADDDTGDDDSYDEIEDDDAG